MTAIEPYTHLICKPMSGVGSRRGNHSAAEYYGRIVTHAGNRAVYRSRFVGEIHGLESLCGKLRTADVGEQDDGRGTARAGSESAKLIGPINCKRCLVILDAAGQATSAD